MSTSSCLVDEQGHHSLAGEIHSEKLMAFARKGVFEKMSLAKLLKPERRHTYLNACRIIEEAIVEACAAKGEPCLAGGCAAEGETCLEACLVAGTSYHAACAAAWIELFKDPDNRIDSWRNLLLS